MATHDCHNYFHVTSQRRVASFWLRVVASGPGKRKIGHTVKGGLTYFYGGKDAFHRVPNLVLVCERGEAGVENGTGWNPSLPWLWG